MAYRDSVKRILKEEKGVTSWISITRRRCPICNKIRRDLPNDIFLPMKHYRKDIIQAFSSGEMDDKFYEDYPSESTIYRWKHEKGLQ